MRLLPGLKSCFVSNQILSARAETAGHSTPVQLRSNDESLCSEIDGYVSCELCHIIAHHKGEPPGLNYQIIVFRLTLSQFKRRCASANFLKDADRFMFLAFVHFLEFLLCRLCQSYHGVLLDVSARSPGQCLFDYLCISPAHICQCLHAGHVRLWLQSHRT